MFSLIPATFLVSFLAVGIPYWNIPYGGANLPDSLFGFGLGVVAAAAFFCRMKREASVFASVIIYGCSVPCAVLARVIVDGIRNPSTHNLWPVELILALFIGCGCSAAGVLLESLLDAVRGRSPG